MKLEDTNNKPVKSTQHSPDTSKSGTEVGVAGTNNSRRHLLKKISATAPVVMAVSSKPALANFCTVSGLMSGNLSSPNDIQSCGGLAPASYIDDSTYGGLEFSTIFSVVWKEDDDTSWDNLKTFNDVLTLPDGEDKYDFGAHAIAAYINAMTVENYGQTPQDVIEIVSEIANSFDEVYTISGTNTIDAEGYVTFLMQTYN